MEQKIIEEGMKLPDFTLMGSDDNMHSPEEFNGKNLFYIFIQRIILPGE